MIPLGLGLVILWIGFEATLPVATPLVHPFVEDAKILSGALLLFGIAFSVFGLGCELVVAVVGRQQSSNDEWDRLADLSGYTAARQPKMVQKRVRVTREELRQIKAMLAELH